jgi:hypothetical protein
MSIFPVDADEAREQRLNATASSMDAIPSVSSTQAKSKKKM